MIEFVKTHAKKPSHHFPEQSFAHEYANSMIRRFNELEREKVFTKENEYYSMAPDWKKKLEHIIRQKQLDLTNEAKTYEHNLKKQNQITLDNHERRSASKDQDRQR